ncbi:MAG TPA: Rrf2 family transcriptional regulator [Vitreimonas sp.]|uniref:Rrf2 family transcriptional regulator n=1 Tax=Vitreimonas sp. TaxID=3069702 RepID=UPI002D2E92DC|nr:Rrf2 family transcriptional regulator [Vitreimonas sp.]HYD86366.1 Rrf2 family transcriptional regulator [Vitreimonas sp.]
MKRNSQLAQALHALIHMAERDGPMTSDEIAACFDTNPVVVRRTMAGLREAGAVASGGGRGGGWKLQRPAASISLLDVYRAIGEPEIFHVGPRAEVSPCLVDHAVGDAMGPAFEEAEQLLLKRLSEITLSDVAADFQRRAARAKKGRRQHGT